MDGLDEMHCLDRYRGDPSLSTLTGTNAAGNVHLR
jgi:hypothetical protein